MWLSLSSFYVAVVVVVVVIVVIVSVVIVFAVVAVVVLVFVLACFGVLEWSSTNLIQNNTSTHSKRS